MLLGPAWSMLAKLVPWRGGAMLFCEPEEDAAQDSGNVATCKGWYKFWRLEREVQEQYGPWEDPKLNHHLRPQNVTAWRKAAASHEDTTGVGEDRSHPSPT